MPGVPQIPPHGPDGARGAPDGREDDGSPAEGLVGFGGRDPQFQTVGVKGDVTPETAATPREAVLTRCQVFATAERAVKAQGDG